MKIRILTYIAGISIMLMGIVFLFWKQEFRYAQPTPVPEELNQVLPGDSVSLTGYGIEPGQSTLIHFFNFDCPCSRFNIKEFKSIVRRYEDEVKFMAVISGEDIDEQDKQKFLKKYDLGIPTIVDRDHQLANELGIYSTPQAVIINKDSKIYFKGNYNKARYCLSRNTQFVEMALGAMVEGKPLPRLPMIATMPYGCSIEENPRGLELLGLF